MSLTLTHKQVNLIIGFCFALAIVLISVLVFMIINDSASCLAEPVQFWVDQNKATCSCFAPGYETKIFYAK